jgi:hypothetical protein
MLRRKPAFSHLHAAPVVNVILHCDRHPELDYVPLQRRPLGEATLIPWIGVHRNRQSRQLVVVQEVKNNRLQDLSCLSKISAPNVARIMALYHKADTVYAVQELVSLDVMDLTPLGESEIAEVFAQVTT